MTTVIIVAFLSVLGFVALDVRRIKRGHTTQTRFEDLKIGILFLVVAALLAYFAIEMWDIPSTPPSRHKYRLFYDIINSIVPNRVDQAIYAFFSVASAFVAGYRLLGVRSGE